MQCQHSVKHGRGQRRCKHTAVTGYNLCQLHGWEPRYYIRFTWQDKAGDHWSKRKTAVWPLLFPSRISAEDHIATVSPFKNMLPRRKLTCCVERTKRTFPKSILRRI